MKHHPDRNPDDKGAEDKFKEAKEAYEDPHRPQEARGLRPVRARGRRSVGGIRRGRCARRRARRLRRLLRCVRRHLRRDLRRSSAAGAATASIAARICATTSSSRSRKRRAAPKPRSASRRLEECDDLSRQRRQARHAAQAMSTCHGRGEVRVSQGFFSIQQTCPDVSRHRQGRPRSVRDLCHGAGRVKKHKTLSVKIPAGVDQDDRIRLTGEGEAGMNGGPSGDLYVVVNLKPHPVFQREGRDLHCEMPISFAIARRSAARSRFRRSTATRRSRFRQRRRRAGVPPAQQGASGPVRGSVHGRSLLPRRDRDAGQAHVAAEGVCCANSRRSTRTIRARNNRRAAAPRAQVIFGP